LVHLQNIGILCELPFLVSVFINAEVEPRHENELDIFKPIESPQMFPLAIGCWLSLREKFLAYSWILSRTEIVQLSHLTRGEYWLVYIFNGFVNYLEFACLCLVTFRIFLLLTGIFHLFDGIFIGFQGSAFILAGCVVQVGVELLGELFG
jgi:hypothetical protein